MKIEYSKASAKALGSYDRPTKQRIKAGIKEVMTMAPISQQIAEMVDILPDAD